MLEGFEPAGSPFTAAVVNRAKDTRSNNRYGLRRVRGLIA